MQSIFSMFSSGPATTPMTDDECSHPGPTLRALELLQQEPFRQQLLSPALLQALTDEGIKHAVPDKD